MSSSTLQLECLVLNRSNRPIRIEPLEDCLVLMAKGYALAYCQEDFMFYPWDLWICLPVTDGNYAIRTTRMTIRAPRTIRLVKYDGSPLKRRRLNIRNMRHRYGNKDAYTGEELSRHESSIDHVIPRSRGGGNNWENAVLCHKKLNALKADRTPTEAGLTLLVKPTEPRKVPFCEILKEILASRKAEGIEYPEDWDSFLKAR